MVTAAGLLRSIFGTRRIRAALVGFPAVRNNVLTVKKWDTGKITIPYFFPPFAETLAECGVDVKKVWHDRFCAEPDAFEVAIFVYSEDAVHGFPDLLPPLVREAEARAEEAGVRVVHPLALAETIIDKTQSHRVLSAAGIPVPRLVAGDTARVLTFSNDNFGSGSPVSLHLPGAALDPKRYNTEFVDTTFRHAGADYYVVLRAMCVGEHCISMYPRARPIADGGPSVHNANTPPDPALINALYDELIAPRYGRIHELCQRIGAVFGLGFYAHDILPVAGSHELIVCESGLKFDDRTIRERLGLLRGAIREDDYLSERSVVSTARAFASIVRAWAENWPNPSKLSSR